MSGIILQGQALKIVNHGGGYPTKTVVDTYRNQIGITNRIHRHYQSREKVKGTDYFIFKCPGCGRRNKRSMYEVKGRAGGALSFTCHSCYREVEVAPPSATKVILDANSPVHGIGIVGPDGKPV